MRQIMLFVALAFWLGVTYLNGQVKMDDFGRIVLNTYLPEDIALPAEAKATLTNKLNQVASSHGMGGSMANPRFVLSASVQIGTKEIIPGPPTMIAQNVDVTLLIIDAMSNTIFANVIVSTKGVGTNENKSFIESFKTINPKNKDIEEFIRNGKNKIIELYNAQCESMIKSAFSLVGQEKYDEAIYNLTLVPEVCEECYFKCLDTMEHIYILKINAECKEKLHEARSIWMASQDTSGAMKAGEVLSQINPLAPCQSDVDNFMKEISAKLRADEKARWDFQMKQYNDRVAAEKEKRRIAEQKSIRDDAYRENQAKRDNAFRENQAERDATYRENQAERDAAYRENQAERDANYREIQADRDAAYRERQMARNYELDKMRISAYRTVAVAYTKRQPPKTRYNTIFSRY